MGQIRSSHNPSDGFQRCTNELVSRCIHGEVLESTLNNPAKQKLLRHRLQYIDSASDPTENPFFRLIPVRQVTFQSLLDRVGQDFGYQVGDIIRIVLCGGVPVQMGGTEQLGRIQHQQPQISNRDAINLSNLSVTYRLHRASAHRVTALPPNAVVPPGLCLRRRTSIPRAAAQSLSPRYGQTTGVHL